jgi:glycosyltransferase involved in cell wall biosynthesis
MGKRKRIGLSVVFDNESNSGIVNYIISVIRGFDLLASENKPELVIFHSATAPLQQIRETGYPHLTFFPLPVDRYRQTGLKRIINALSIRIFKKFVFENQVPPNTVDFIFPVFPFDWYYDKIRNKVNWLVDFNPYYFPDHYEDKGEWYKQWHSRIAATTERVVLSSYSSYDDYKKFYPAHKTEVHIIRFSAMLPDFSGVDVNALKKRLGINDPYFITPNQFWEHKNHIVILKAFKKLSETGHSIELVFTGSMGVNRGKGFQFEKLKEFVNANGLTEKVHFLGVMDRKEQLALMANSAAIIQPSLFEGWSTLVEESKSIGKFIILSDIPVHREQIDKNCLFFDPHSPDDLVEKVKDFLSGGSKFEPVDYKPAALQFADDLLKVYH